MRLFSGSDDYRSDDDGPESLADLMVKRDREYSPVECESFSEKMIKTDNEMSKTKRNNHVVD